jgi:hypothetical protein
VNYLQTKAFVDTTILTDALLKQGVQRSIARNAIAGFAQSQLPMYAIKEFKAGPLRNYVWFHNKVVTASTWEDAVASIATVRRQANKMSTALQALSDFTSSVGKQLPANLAASYPNTTLGEIQKKEGATWLKLKILQAWRHRRKLTTEIVAPLKCYKELDLKVDRNGLIDDRLVVCSVVDCCLRAQFVADAALVSSLLQACDQLPAKPETTKRRQSLKQLSRLPKRPLSEKDCRNLGDAVFAFQCPKDAVILTTNLADHSVLAGAAGVTAVKP